MTRKLPAGRCVSHAIRSVQNNLRYAFRISWPWYVVLVVIGLGISFLADYMTGGNPQADPVALLPLLPAYAVVVIINLLAFASIAVNWHRYILLDEVPRGNEVFRLDGLTWRYIGNLILIFLIVLAAAVIYVALASGLGLLSDALGTILFIGGFVAWVFGLICVYRLSVKLPAIAIGRRDFLMRDAWKATEDNKLPIFLVILLIFLITFGLLIAGLAIVLIAVFINPIVGIIIGGILQLLASWIMTIFGITVLTSLYGFFVEGRDF